MIQTSMADPITLAKPIRCELTLAVIEDVRGDTLTAQRLSSCGSALGGTKPRM